MKKIHLVWHRSECLEVLQRYPDSQIERSQWRQISRCCSRKCVCCVCANKAKDTKRASVPLHACEFFPHSSALTYTEAKTNLVCEAIFSNFPSYITTRNGFLLLRKGGDKNRRRSFYRIPWNARSSLIQTVLFFQIRQTMRHMSEEICGFSAAARSHFWLHGAGNTEGRLFTRALIHTSLL